jgi:hypothetical protein
VENSTIDGSGLGTQVGIAPSDGAVVQGNTVNGNGEAGIAVSIDSSAITIGGSLSGQGNGGASNEAGIVVEGPGSGTVSVVDNSVGGVEFGTLLAGVNDQVVFTGNTVSESAEEGIGLVLEETFEELGANSISDNQISGTIGALVDDSSTYNTLSGNTINGLLTGLAVPGNFNPVDVNSLLGPTGFDITTGTNTHNTFSNNTLSGSLGANAVDLTGFDGQNAPNCGTVTTTSKIVADTTVSSVNLAVTQTCTLDPGAYMTNAGFGEEMYVTQATTILSTTVGGTAVPVSNFITAASAQLNNGLNSGSTLTVDSFGPGANAGGNTFSSGASANSCTPDFNGSATLDTATGSAGYLSC